MTLQGFKQVLAQSFRSRVGRLRAWLSGEGSGPVRDDNGQREQASVLGLEEVPTREDLDRRLAGLPSSFRELFARVPVTDFRLLVHRESEREALLKAVERWRGGAKPLVALVGPDVCGKTSLLNWLRRELEPTKEVRGLTPETRLRSEADVIAFFARGFELSEVPPSLDALMEQLVSVPPQVVLLDDVHHLLLRAVGLSEIFHRLLAVWLGTRERLLWVLTFGEHAWRRLDYQFALSRYVTDLIRVPYFTEEEIKTMLLVRQDLTGLGPSFVEERNEDEVEDSHPEPLRSPEEREEAEEAAKKRYFSRLYRHSYGNLHAAIVYWIMGLRFDEPTGTVAIGPSKAADLGFVRELDERSLFTLAELFANGWLTPKEHAEVFQLPPITSRVTLEALDRQRLVEKTRQRTAVSLPVYRINPMVHGQLANLLESSHVLY